ncbi:MAG: Rid family detoxifying hydrolase [bacterium]
MARMTIATPQAPQPIGPYVQGIRAGDLLFLSGQLPLDPLTGSLVRSGIRAQTRRVLDNLKAVLEAAGATLAHIVRLTLYVKTLDDVPQANEVIAELLTPHLPTRMTVEVPRLPKDASVAMDAIAYLGS